MYIKKYNLFNYKSYNYNLIITLFKYKYYILLIKYSKNFFKNSSISYYIKNNLYVLMNFFKKINCIKVQNNFVKSKFYKKEKHTVYKLPNHIVIIHMFKSNIFINLTNIKGNSNFIFSSGLLNYNGVQKVRKFALNNIIKKLNFKLYKLNIKNITIHFKGIKKYRKNIIKELKNNVNIHYFKILNYKPHNGCRPKKFIGKK